MDKVSLIIASGDLPDAIACGTQFGGSTFSQSQLDQYGAQGIFIPVQDLIREHSIHLRSFLEKRPDIESFVTSLDGNIYSFFGVNECYHCNHQQKAWINSTWLKNLNLEMPRTTDDLKNVLMALMAFKTQDPNRNGKPDEIPMAASVDGWRTNIDGFLMCAFIYTDSDQNLVFDKNKKIQYGPAQNEWREGLKYLRDLYVNGLIAPESFTQSTSMLAQINEAGEEPVIGVGFGGVNFLCSGAAVSDKFKQYDALPPLTGPNGYASVASYNNLAPADVGIFVITKAAKEPALIMRWLDYWYSEDGRNWLDMGKKGRDWREGDGDTELMLFQATKLYEPFAFPNSELVPTIVALPDKITDFSLIKTSITEYTKQHVARFVTGDLDIYNDADWNNYIKGLNDLGLQKYLDICQEGYEAKYGKSR